MPERKTSLRVLYTINSSPQYILARSLSPVSITIIPHQEEPRATQPYATQAALYASVTLKTCLDAICRSSPDLTQDTSRDFSLYVLDPLESNSAPAPVNISNAHGDTGSLNNAAVEKPRPVAVGLGLMSWALASNDHNLIFVTGTLMKQPNGQEALEVIFALRETIAVKQRVWNMSSSQESALTETSTHTDSKKPQWYSTSQEQSLSSTILSRSASNSDLSRETVRAAQVRANSNIKVRRQARYSNTPMTESDKLMSVADTYIGPLKKKGRPKMNTEVRVSKAQRHHVSSGQVLGQREVIVLDASDDENNPGSAQDPTTITQKSSQPRPPFTNAPLVRHQTQKTGVDIQVKPERSGNAPVDPLTLLSASSVDSTISNAALLTALATIDSNKTHGENPQNKDLITALRQFLAIYTTNASHNTTPPVPEPTVRRHSQSSSKTQSDGLVYLDKENVNPTISKKCREKNGLDKFSDPLPFALNSAKERAMRPSARVNEMGSTATPSQSVPVVRKRTLSDFMDERESGRKSKGKGRETKRHDRRRDSGLQRSEMPSVEDVMRHYPQVLAANLPRLGQPSNYYRTPSDPSTSPARGRADNNQFSSTDDCGSNSSRHLSQWVSASSPIRPKVPKRYVVPEWARTTTATRPRLSEEAKRALEEAEARKREERNAARRKLTARMKSEEVANARKAVIDKPAEQPSRFIIARKSDLSQAPISASSDGPVIAFPLLSTSRSSSPPPQPPSVPRTPKTPSKSRVSSHCGEEDGSLFTPSGSLFGSAVSRRSDHGMPPSVLTSPLGNRKKAKVSSSQTIFTETDLTSLRAWASRSSPNTAPDSEEHERLSNWSKEVSVDLDGPPGSLPIASSDIDVDWSYSQSTGDSRDDDTGEETVKQHWAGLPPSSPPPPSSPMLVPENRSDDEDMDELPIASDSEADVAMNASDAALDNLPSAIETLEPEASRSTMEFPDEHSTVSFSMENPSSSLFQLSSSTALDLFEQYTNVNAQSDDVSAVCRSDADLQTVVQNGIGNIDFTEFWETFKPMVSENTEPLQEDSIERSMAEFFGMENTQLMSGDIAIDLGKLSDEIQSLLSGYLV